jgi:hypothetical protein
MLFDDICPGPVPEDTAPAVAAASSAKRFRKAKNARSIHGILLAALESAAGAGSTDTVE